MAEGERAEFERDQQHIGAGPRLREPRRDREARDAAGAAEAEHRHARDVGRESPSAPATRASRLGVAMPVEETVTTVSMSPADRSARASALPRDIDEQRLGAFEKGLRALRPAALLEIPFDRLDAVAVADAGIGEQARKRFELADSARPAAVRRFEDLVLMKLMRREPRSPGKQVRPSDSYYSLCMCYPEI